MVNSYGNREIVKEKLEDMNGGYRVEDFCAGRFLISSLVHPKSENFSMDEKKEIARMVEQRAYADFDTCVSTANLITSHLFGFGLPNIRDDNAGYQQFTSEIDVMAYYAQNYQALGISYDELSQKAKDYIHKYKKPTNRRRKKEHRDVEVYFLSKPSLLEHFPQFTEEDLNSFQGFKTRPKIDVAEKFLVRASKLLSPSKKDLETIVTSNKVGSNYLKEQVSSYLTNVLQSGRDFHDVRQDDAFNYKLLNPDYINIEEFLNSVGDLFLIDTGGATLYVDNESIPYINSSMQHLNRKNILNLLPHRYEDNSKPIDPQDPLSYPKDGAILYGVQGMLGSSFCEIRFNTPLKGLEGTIGSKEHKGYKNNVKREISRRINRDQDLRYVAEEKNAMFD